MSFDASSDLRIGGPRRRLPILPLLLALSLAANLWFITSWAPEGSGEPGPVTETAVALAEAESQPAAAPPAAAEAAVAAPEQPAAAPSPEGEAESDAWPRYVRGDIQGPVASAVVQVVGSGEGDRVAATVGRLLSWYIDVTSDPRRGDVLEILYEPDPVEANAIIIEGMRYRSQKMGKTFEAWLYQPQGWKFPSWFDAAGRRVPATLKNSPIENYEQITSLIGDGRGHAGMDFKTPEGTPVTAPFAGKVLRTNWNGRFNGNCVEVSAGNKLVRFLHLKAVDDKVKAGATVSMGQRIGVTGNTGRSFAPHLHYELRSNDKRKKVLDPLKVHGFTHGQLPAADGVGFEQRRTELAARMDAAAALE